MKPCCLKKLDKGKVAARASHSSDSTLALLAPLPTRLHVCWVSSFGLTQDECESAGKGRVGGAVGYTEGMYKSLGGTLV